MSRHLRVLKPAPGILAFYDGRIEGYRFDQGPNWVDDGALGLGIVGYAILDGDEALVYDTGVSVEHARFVREELGRRGAARLTVVLSHWHLDHVAGTAAFADSEVIANERTAEHLRTRRAAIEAGARWRDRRRSRRWWRRRDGPLAPRPTAAALRRRDGGHRHLRRRARPVRRAPP